MNVALAIEGTLSDFDSSYIDHLDVLGVIELIVVHWEQVDQWEDGLSFRCAAPSGLSPQRDTSEPSRFHRHTRETRDIRQVCLILSR